MHSGLEFLAVSTCLSFQHVMFLSGIQGPQKLETSGPLKHDVCLHRPLDGLSLPLTSRDHIQKMEGPVATTQRCVMVLLGLGQEIGASGVSIATMFRPTAVEYLNSRVKM